MSDSAQLFEVNTQINDTLLDKDHTFSSNEFNLDKRLVKALSGMGFIHPTVVQSQCIPRLLEGKDLLVKANTGSGKTIAYGVPILQKLLSNAVDKNNKDVKVLILAPSRELCLQTRDVFKCIMKYISDLFTCQVLEDGDVNIQKARLLECPDILISTPYLLVKFLNMKAVSISNISTLVIDEADLTLSYGYEEDMKVITNNIPTICQSILMSATLNDDVNKLRKGLLTNEVVIKVDQDTNKNINQYFINVKNRDEDILIFALLKLHVIQGKVLFFVNSIDRCYYLKLFLEQFSIPSAVLNSELPVKSRENIIQQFNKGKFDYLIATDESFNVSMGNESNEKKEDSDDELLKSDSEEEENDSDSESEDEEMDKESNEEEEANDSDSDVFDMSGDSDDEEPELEEEESNAKSTQAAPKNNTEYDVSRGIDFKNVSCVINYDFPLTKDSYIHRIGRTARAGNVGIALSIVHKDDEEANTLLKTLQTVLPLNNGVPQPSPLPFNMAEVEAFRYRIEDVRRAVTRVAIKESRIKEIQQELYNSKLLQSHFEDNPQELNLLHHARPLLPRRVKSYLRDIPDYLIPESLRTTHSSHSISINGGRRNIYIKKKKNDPLQSFAMTMETLKTAPRSVTQSISDEKAILSGRNYWKLKHHKGVFKHGFHKGMTTVQRIKRRAINKHGGKDKYGRQR